MSRFDRRLKGGGLRPGQSTCKIRTAPAKVMSSGFSNTRVGGSNYATAYNPVVPGVNMGVAQQNFQVQSSASSQQQEQMSQNKVYISQEELGVKNRKLEQYALTAPSTEMKTLTMHEIRLNKLEWINDQAEKMMDEDESIGNLESNVNINDLIDAKLSTYTLTTLDPRLKLKDSSTHGNNSTGNSGEMTVKFNNLNTVSMKVQQDVNVLKTDVKIIKGGIKAFATNLQGIAMMKKDLDTSKKEINSLRANYKKLKEEFESYLLKLNNKHVKLNINEIEAEKKKMDESEVRDVVVKAIKNKSVN